MGELYTFIIFKSNQLRNNQVALASICLFNYI